VSKSILGNDLGIKYEPLTCLKKFSIFPQKVMNFEKAMLTKKKDILTSARSVAYVWPAGTSDFPAFFHICGKTDPI
jgi:hypothetical protein